MNAPANLQSRVRDYLDERRRLGFQLKSAGRALMSFARYVDALEQAGPLTQDVMIEWAQHDKQGRHRPETWARRFKLLRPFALICSNSNRKPRFLTNPFSARCRAG